MRGQHYSNLVRRRNFTLEMMNLGEFSTAKEAAVTWLCPPSPLSYTTLSTNMIITSHDKFIMYSVRYGGAVYRFIVYCGVVCVYFARIIYNRQLLLSWRRRLCFDSVCLSSTMCSVFFLFDVFYNT